MLTSAATHPSADTLRAFGLGQLDEPSAISVMNHLDGCAFWLVSEADIGIVIQGTQRRAFFTGSDLKHLVRTSRPSAMLLSESVVVNRPDDDH